MTGHVLFGIDELESNRRDRC